MLTRKPPVALEVGPRWVWDRGNGLEPAWALRTPGGGPGAARRGLRRWGRASRAGARGPLLRGASGAEAETRPQPWADARGGGEAAWRGRGGPGGRAGLEPRGGGEGAPSPTPLARENVGDLLEVGGLQIEEGALVVLQLLPGR